MDATVAKSLLSDYEHYYEAASFLPQQRDKDEVKRFAGIAASIGANLDILDVGCAEGELAAALAKQGHRVTAADISQAFLEQARKRAIGEGTAVATVLLDIERPPDQAMEKTFDLIYLMDVLEHLRNPAQGLASLRAMLRDNGTLVLHTPNLCTPSGVYRYAKFRKRRENFFRPENLGDLHLQGWDYQTLEKTLNFAGLRVRDVLPTVVSLPVLYRFAWALPLSRRLSALFPMLSDTLLVACDKVAPIDLERQLEYWRAHPPRTR
jgi:2-polyprenyl-3-methyl-5-hydroxy-6-metoxy-1,4-benzoquinol methylase